MPTTVEEIEKTDTDKRDKDELLLDSLEIKGYRCFEHLTIEKLGRVNLIVGKNSVGKTALLEALWIYSRRGKIDTLLHLLFLRDEIALSFTAPTEIRLQKTQDFVSKAGNLFNGRPQLKLGSNESVFVGSSNSSVKVFTSRLIDQDESSTLNYSVFKEVWGKFPTGLLLISTLKEENTETRTEFYSFDNLQSFLLETTENIPHVFVTSQILDNSVLANFWDEAVIKGLEETARDFLKLVKPTLEYINFVGGSEENGVRYPIANSENFNSGNNRVPLKSYGEGMTRLLGLCLAFVQCKNGILLLDEIESGLHYSVLPDVWKLIFKTAKDLNVQVFATTHSKDCIEAFTQAAVESPENGELIRLERHGEKIVAKTIDEDRLAQAINHDVEVR